MRFRSPGLREGVAVPEGQRDLREGRSGGQREYRRSSLLTTAREEGVAATVGS